MIHRVLLFNKKTKELLADMQFWKVLITDEDTSDFFNGLEDIESSPNIDNEMPLFVDEGKHRVYHRSLMNNKYLLTFWTDGKNEDKTINGQIKKASENIIQTLRESSIDVVKQTFRNVLGDTVFTKFKICFVGSGGVGKTTLFKLLFGKQFTVGYSPSPGVTISGDSFDFGTFKIHLWDFPGQVVLQPQWDFFLKGTDAIFLVTDSSFRNVIKTKGLMKKIKDDAPAVPLFVVANKQDLMESMQAMKIQRLLGQKTIPMIAAPLKENRDEQREFFLDILLEIACKSAGVDKPDVSVKDVILVSGKEVESFEEEKTPDVAWQDEVDNKPKMFLLLKKVDDIREIIGWIPYETNQNVSDLVNLITALEKEDPLKELKYEGGKVHLHASEHFEALFVVNNSQNEELYRSALRRITNAMELSLVSVDSDPILEQYILECLVDVPVVALNGKHVLERTKKDLFGFSHPMLNRLIERVAKAFAIKSRVEDVAETIGMPKVAFYGMVQLLIHIGSLVYAEPIA